MNAPYLGPEVTRELLAGISTDVDAMIQKLSFAVGLSPIDKMRLQGLGRNRVQFVKLTLENLQQNPILVPPYLSAVAVERNYGLHEDIEKLREKVNQVQRLLVDTVHYTGSKAASDALAYYSVVKRAALKGVPGAELAAEMMKATIRSAKRPGETPPVVPPAEVPAT